MPVAAALDQFDAAARVAIGDPQDDRAHLAGCPLIAQPGRKLPRVERIVAREQHRLYGAFQIVDHVAAAFR